MQLIVESLFYRQTIEMPKAGQSIKTVLSAFRGFKSLEFRVCAACFERRRSFVRGHACDFLPFKMFEMLKIIVEEDEERIGADV
ncbi:MAG: hypothetical protein MK165_00570 [Pirellulaceae bacterium]|nr:hypothetical protein [Pirellulaceae bacterium]